MRGYGLIGGGALLAGLFAGFASAETYNIETFGVFRDLMLKGDFTPKVAIGSVMSRHPSTGVGAVSGARGEITIADGKLIISYGKSDAHPAPDSETAALLATGTVNAWQAIRVDTDVAPPAVEHFLRSRENPRPRSGQVISLPVARDGRALRHARQCRTY